ncbi:uncharacterized protein LOC100142497 isoform X2 [Tribolium castaneum]|uniref:Uncharacterized protein n=1 Tax=Tribolium castaneum TaxID=7070 RepID=A0A139WGV3_TRICA|nr:PREDICTED: uncharacterized protein LOC100142497 isoform X2 [Tribolium castaneum]KYB27193.1 hypothetical protein TcasGA2_TC013455 [Tribolium castaneum]|eukprot:XP_001815756.1 PREDICTED: uncharacterized protein LOC100142497 isoform X2 [Tribolium castaneum]
MESEMLISNCYCSMRSVLALFGYDERDCQTWSELAALVVHNDPTLKTYVKHHHQIATRHYNSILHLSIIFNKKNVFDYVLSQNVNINCINSYGQTPLVLAVMAGSEYFTKCLLEMGADVQRGDEFGCTPLHAAVAGRNRRICTMLLDMGADVNCRNSDGKTPLHHASELGCEDAMYALLYYGADARIADIHNHLPLEGALLWFDNDSQEILFNHTLDDEITFSMRVLILALEFNLFLVPDILKRLERDYTMTDSDILKFWQNIISVKLEYAVIVFERMRESNIDIELWQWSWLWFVEGQLDQPVTKLLEILGFLLENDSNSYYTSAPHVITSAFLFSVHNGASLSLDVLQKALLFLFSYGCEPYYRDLVYSYKYWGFGDVVKFLLTFDLVVEKHLDVMPLLIYDVNVTIDEAVAGKDEPPEDYGQILKFFAGYKVRRLLESPNLARDEARKYILREFEIKHCRDFYGLIRKMPINGVYKKILTYETPVYFY